MEQRRLKLIRPRSTKEGVKAEANRLIPNGGEHLDPFVIFDEYWVYPDASFPEHPHGGFEGFQYLMEGSTEYKDDRGNVGVIGPGDLRRFVAGKGFRHSEVPVSKETVRGYLLWIKIPRDHSNTPIIYEETSSQEVPLNSEDGVKVRTLLGGESPVKSHTPAVWKHIQFETGGGFSDEISTEWNGFVYVPKGKVEIDGIGIGPSEGAILKEKGEYMFKGEAGTEMVFIKGRKIGERIVQKEHFVLWGDGGDE